MTTARIASRTAVTSAHRARSVIASGGGGTHMAGRRSRQGDAASNAADAASTVASAWRRPTIWRPTGSPSSVHPAGTLAAGWAVMLNGYVEGIPAGNRDY